MVKPSGVGSGVGEQDDNCTREGRFVAFTGPFPHVLAAGRIAKDGMPAPILEQAVILLCEIARALGVLDRGARIEREVKFCVEPVEKRLRVGHSSVRLAYRASWIIYSVSQECG